MHVEADRPRAPDSARGRVAARSASRGRAAPRSRAAARFDATRRPPGVRIGRVAVLRHRVAEVGDPGNAPSRGAAPRDQVRGGDRIGRPDHVGTEFPDQPPAPAGTAPSVQVRQRSGRASARDTGRHGQVSSGVEREGAVHDGAREPRRAGRREVCGCTRVARRQHAAAASRAPAGAARSATCAARRWRPPAAGSERRPSARGAAAAAGDGEERVGH